MRNLVIDGDIILYSAGFASQCVTTVVSVGNEILGEFESKKDIKKYLSTVFQDDNYPPLSYEDELVVEPASHALQNTKLMIEEILDVCQPETYTVYFSGDTNYRKELYPEYKKNRDPTHKPVHLGAIKDYCISNWNGRTVGQVEADDLLGIEGMEGSCIASIDKDLLMIPTLHYNIRKGDFIEVDTQTANVTFLRQWLTGDSTDNIPGLKGIGPKRAQKLIPDNIDTKEAIDIVLETYKDEDNAWLNASLVWILRRYEKNLSVETIKDQIKHSLGYT